MSSSIEIAPPTVRWNLSSLYESPEDPKIEQTWASVFDRAKRFDAHFRGKINDPDLNPAFLTEAIVELESIAQESSKPGSYAQLLFACDSSDPALGAFMQKQMEKGSELNVQLMFFEIELQAAPEAAIQRALSDPATAKYRHYIQVARTYSAHRLSEKEEVILEEVANTGCRAWVRLFEEVTSNYEFSVLLPGEKKPKGMTQSEVLDLLRHPDRATRQAGADAFTEGLKSMERVLVFTFNTLLQDKNVEDRLRRYEYAEQSRHKANELDRTTVDLVVRLCKEHYGLVERFYRVKREILGLPELTHVDRYAPLFETKEKVGWEDAKAIVLESFGKFSQEISTRAEEFFAEGWIDAEPRKGKQGGAFCAYVTPDTHPVVFVNYLCKMDDVSTLAHELGHGVHSSLSREQTYFNYHGTLPLAELASTFGEMLVFERLVSTATIKDQLALYAEKIEGIFATVFRQAAMFRFEKAIHNARRAEGELAPETFGDLWQEKLQEMFGDSVKLGEQHRHWWSYVGHFVFAPFYVYAYSFGELLVLSLFQMSKKEGPSFAKKYEDLLRLGGSLSPAELMATVDVDLTSESFWKGGLQAMEKMIVQFETLWSQVRTS